jgi:hypothetical protein
VTPFRRKQLIGIAGALPAFVVVAVVLDHAARLFDFLSFVPDAIGGMRCPLINWC